MGCVTGWAFSDALLVLGWSGNDDFSVARNREWIFNGSVAGVVGGLAATNVCRRGRCRT